MSRYVSSSRGRRAAVGISFLLAATVLSSSAIVGSLSAAALPLISQAQSQPATAVADDGSRTMDFDTGWKFVLVNSTNITDPTGIYGNAAAPLANAVAFDDSSWRSLNVPHDWSIERTPVSISGTTSGTGFFEGGLGWYRKTFTLPPSMAGKKISIDFDGVYMDSYEWLNGTLLGNHPYGYTGFSFDVSSLVHTDGVTPNVLAVVVQNRLPSSRWYSGSGITRNVHLTVTDPIHVTRFGTFVTTPGLAATAPGSAIVHVSTDVINQSGADATVDLSYQIKDAAGADVAGTTTSGVLLDSSVHNDAVDIAVSDPHLWSTDDPYLYSLVTTIWKDGAPVDTTSTTFGIRWLVFDPTLGVSLNGQPFKIQGVDLHHDEGALGSINNYDALYREMSILKGMGVNAFRTSHNPPSPEWIAVCERLGIVMMVEAFDTWGSTKTQFDYGRFFNVAAPGGTTWGDSDIKEMVNQAKNSPAVVMWSIGNEIPNFSSNANLLVADRLIADIKSIDTTRPVVAGSDQYRNPPAIGSNGEKMLLKLDGLGLNYNPAKAVDVLHARYPDKFFFESESSSETATRGIYQDPTYVNTGENYTPGKRGTSSYDNNLASWTMSNEYGLKKDRDRQFFAGQFIWSGFDYIGEPTPYNVFPVKASFFGTIDTAGFPKDAYYAFQTQWTPAPMMHLVPMNWTNYKPGENVEVWAYSNVDTVELFINEASLGTKTFDHKTTAYGKPYLETTECSNDDKNYTTGTCIGSYQSPNGDSGKLHLTWIVPFAPGSLVAVARLGGVEVARDELRTAGAPATLRITPDKTVIKANGKSLSYLTVEVVDSNGVVVPNANIPINISVTGSGAFVGADNGQQESAESYKATTHSSFNGKLLVIVQGGHTPGPVTVGLSSSGLLPAITTLYASNEAGSGIIAVRPTYVRSELGSPVALPGTVDAIHADGTVEPLAVTWDALPAVASVRTGVYPLKGAVSGTGIPAQGTVTVYSVGGLESYSTAVATGSPPRLPARIHLVYNDGVDAFVPVTWDPIDPAQYASAGLFTVNGTVAGTSLPAIATIRVTDAFVPGQNIARSTSPLRPSADASYSGATGSVPAGMLDGTTSTGGWSNAYNKSQTNILPPVSKAHPKEWVSVGWPIPQRVGTVSAYFTVTLTGNNQRRQPATLGVSYWDGSNWVAVSNLNIVFAATTNQPTSITFDPVTTSELRFDMTSPFPDLNTGFIQITELQVTGNVVTYNTAASLTDLQVDGQTVPGFDPLTTAYTVPSGHYPPQIAATAADNGRLLIVPPITIPGMARVTVTSEDGTAQKTYTVWLTPTVSELSPAHGWLGLKNGDDQGTNFDLRIELLKNGTTVATGLQRCITGVTRNPTLAKEAIVPWGAFPPVPVASGDVLAVRVSARIGTNPNDTKCAGHNSAVGVRLYYDAATRGSRFDITIGAAPSTDLYLHSDGAACNNAPSVGANNLTLNNSTPVAAAAKCKDAAIVNFAGGNKWVTLSTWSLAGLP